VTLIKVKKVEIINDNYGEKIRLSFDYNQKWVALIKSIPWNETHRYWDGKGWVFDKTPHSAMLLRQVLHDIPEELEELIGEFDIGKLGKVKVVIDGTTAKIRTELPDEVISRIDQRLSYQPAGYEHSYKYQEGEWDGFIRLFRINDYSFPIGLIYDVETEISREGYQLDIIDNRKLGKKIKYQWYGPELREYQTRVIKKLISNNGGTVCMPTGSGKTITALKLIYLLFRKTIIIVHRSVLLYQWKKVIKEYLHINPGIIGDGKFSEGLITVAMIQTLCKKDLKEKYDVIICDEAHRIPADTFVETVKRINTKYRIGLTATPFREDGKDLLIFSQMGKIIEVVTVQELIKKGYLAQPKFKILRMNRNNIRYGRYTESVYTHYIVNNERRNKKAIREAIEMFQKGYKIYIDVKRVFHGKKIVRMLKEEGINDVYFIYGKTKTEERQKVLKMFSQGNIILVSTLIKEGVDLPTMNGIILAGAGKSKVEMIQIIGRALRPKDRENYAIIVDFNDNVDFFGYQSYQRRKAMKEYYKDAYIEM